MDQPTLFRERYRTFAIACGSIVAISGFVIAVGWAAGIPALISFGAGSGRVKFNAGASLILLGGALVLLLLEERSSVARTTSQWFTGTASVIAGITLLEYAGGWDLGIDQLFFLERDAGDTQHPGRMSVVGSVVVLLLGIALLLLARDANAVWIEVTVLLAAVNVSIPLIGYLYGKTALYQIPFYGTVAFPVAAGLLLLCAGILAARPDQGTMALLTNRSAGGMTARRLLPAALVLPVVIERLQFWGHEAGFYDLTVGMIMITLTSMFVFTLLILWNARILLRLDARRNEAESMVHEALDVLESNLHALSASNARARLRGRRAPCGGRIAVP